MAKPKNTLWYDFQINSGTREPMTLRPDEIRRGKIRRRLERKLEEKRLREEAEAFG